MSLQNRVDQQAVTEWFDSVYRRKGTRYLRPERAYLVFMELLEAKPEHRLLDVACGPGVMLQAASRYTSHLHGIDISSAAIEQALASRIAADFREGNAERLPYTDGSFDLITCLGSLERMLDRSQALAEMWRVGANDARYCFLVRNSNTFTWRHLRPFVAKQRTEGHADADTLENWTRLFESHGFCVLQVLPDQYPLQRRRRRAALFLRPVDYREPILPAGPIDHANEFVFILGKRA